MVIVVLVAVLSTEGNRIEEGSDLQDGGSVRRGVLESVLKALFQHEAVGNNQIRRHHVGDLGR